MSKNIKAIETTVRLTELAQKLVKEAVKSDDVVIDATVGNGIDTIWLRHCIDHTGVVIGFDIQSCALEMAQSKLTEAFGQVPDNVRLLCRCHSHLIDTLQETSPETSHIKIGAAMFNLGYLPGGDHTITTRTETTELAINQAVSALRDGGIITIVVYLGQNNDRAELNAVKKLCLELQNSQFSVTHYTAENRSELAPQLFVVQKDSVNEPIA